MSEDVTKPTNDSKNEVQLKHFRYSEPFKKPDILIIPNIMGTTRDEDHSYTPLNVDSCDM